MYTDQATLDELILSQWVANGDQWYAGLLNTLPSNGLASPGVEVSGGSYARVLVTIDSGAAGWRHLSGLNPYYTFPTATGNWGEIVGLGFWTTPSGGVAPEFTIPLFPTITVQNGDIVRMPATFTPGGPVVDNSPFFGLENQVVTDPADSMIDPGMAASALINALMNNDTFLALYSGIFGEPGFTEISSAGYGRQLLTWESPDFTLPATLVQSGSVTFTAEEDWPTFNCLAFCNTESGPGLRGWIYIDDTTLMNGDSMTVGGASPISVRLV